MLTYKDRNDLHILLDKYKESEGLNISLSEGNWTITEGVYSKWWELYYGDAAKDILPIADCVGGIVRVSSTNSYRLPPTEIKGVILSCLTYLK